MEEREGKELQLQEKRVNELKREALYLFFPHDPILKKIKITNNQTY